MATAAPVVLVCFETDTPLPLPVRVADVVLDAQARCELRRHRHLDYSEEGAAMGSENSSWGL